MNCKMSGKYTAEDAVSLLLINICMNDAEMMRTFVLQLDQIKNSIDHKSIEPLIYISFDLTC
jgi:hypothetical protein